MSRTGTRELRPSRVDRFAGLSNRKVVSGLTRIECPDLLNVDYSKRSANRRGGFQRQHSDMMRDASARWNGRNQWARIRHQIAYDGSLGFALGIHVVLWEFPSSEVTIVSRGFGSGSSRFLQISYDPTINSNNGGWRMRAWDNNASALRSITVSDGDGNTSPVGLTRSIIVQLDAGTEFDFEVLAEDGTSIGSQSFTQGGWISDTNDWFIGVGTTDGSTRDTDYAHCSTAELRIYNSATKITHVAGRELDSGPNSTEFNGLVGYWKMNDGTGSQLADSSTGNSNHGVIGGEGPEWVTDSTLVLGRSGLRFLGESGFLHIQLDSPNYTFTAASGPTSSRQWSVSCLLTPILAEGESTVRDQTIFWSGETSTDPSPLGLTVVSDQLRAHYRDGTGTKTADTSFSGGLSALAGTRLRVLITLVAAEALLISVVAEGLPGSGSAATTATDNADPLNVSLDWSIGGKLTGITSPPLGVLSAGRTYMIVDDFRVFRQTDANVSLNQAPLPEYNYPFTELSDAANVSSYVQMTHSVKMNEAAGVNLTVDGSKGGSAYLWGEPEEGVRWDQGLVDPYLPPEVTLVHDFSRIGKDGSTLQQRLMVSGCTLYKVEDGTLTPIAAGLHKGGPWSVTQYNGRLYMGNKAGYPVRVWDGSFLNWNGIAAPQKIANVTFSDSGGSLAEGTYHLYVTYRNAHTGSESNPNPPDDFSIGSAGTGRVDQYWIPTSADPQVNQRRIYMTVADGGAGSTAYLIRTVDDNVTNTITEDITSVDTTQPTLEYTANMQSPPGRVVKAWKDMLAVGGTPENPTLVWFSAFGVLSAFDPSRFVEVTRDHGDPVTAFHADANDLEVHLRDGRKSLFLTQVSDDPVAIADLPASRAAVNPNAVIKIDGSKYFMAERDLIESATRDVSITSPPSEDFPSVAGIFTDFMDETRRDRWSLAYHEEKRQIWMAYSSDQNSGRNDRVLVYHRDQGIFSLYAMEVDQLAQIENAQDSSGIYGASRGYLVRLDVGTWDGPDSGETLSNLSGTATSGSTDSLQDTSQSWTVDRYKGLTAAWYDASAGVKREAVIRSNTSDTLSFYSSVTAPASGDSYWIAAIPVFQVFVIDGGSTMDKKRIRWMKISGQATASDGTNPLLSVTVVGDDLSGAPSFSSGTNQTIEWDPVESFQRVRLGGIGRVFLVRVGESGLADVNTEDMLPTHDGQIDIHEFEIEVTSLGAP